MPKKTKFILNFFLANILFVVTIYDAPLTYARDVSSIEIHANSGASLQIHLLLIDPYGNKTGLDPSTNIEVDQIPDSGHDTEDLPGLLPTSIIVVGRPKSGTYNLNVIGVALAEYTVEFSLTGSSGNTHVSVLKGITDNEVISTYIITYDPASGVTPRVERVVTIEDAKKDVNIAFDLGLIDNPGIKQSLLSKLDAIEKATNEGQKPTAINQLNTFINEVNAQKGKHIKDDAAKILLEDAQYIMDNL